MMVEVYGFKSVDLVGYLIDLVVAAKILVALVCRHCVFGIAIDYDEIVLVFVDFGDVLVIDDICVVIGFKVCFVVVVCDELNKVFDCF